jgi:hypothetical protein
MIEQLKLWLGGTLRELVNVQGSIVNPAPGLIPRILPVDVYVMLWTGVVVNIYFVDEALKPRAIRQLVQQDTSQGIGVLFIIAPELLPQPNEAFVPPDWLMALHALAHERVYSYALEDEGPLLLQVHFERLDATEHYKTIYGPPVQFQKLNYGRVSLKQRFIKGFWLTATFGMQTFWEQDARSSYTPRPRAQYQATSGWTYSGPDAAPSSNSKSASSAPPPPKRPLSRLDLSYEILGLTANASDEEVKIAFRRRVFNVHPDVSALPKSIAEEQFHALAQAYETIKAARGWS